MPELGPGKAFCEKNRSALARTVQLESALCQFNDVDGNFRHICPLLFWWVEHVSHWHIVMQSGGGIHAINRAARLLKSTSTLPSIIASRPSAPPGSSERYNVNGLGGHLSRIDSIATPPWARQI